MRRSASSIPTNIAEGCGRNSDAELNEFLIYAMGSAAELEYQLLLSKDLHYIENEHYTTLNDKLVYIRKILNIFIHKLKIKN